MLKINVAIPKINICTIASASGTILVESSTNATQKVGPAVSVR